LAYFFEGEMIDLIAQVGITLFGMSAVILAAFKEEKIRKWAYVCGLLSEPFWLITLIYHQQWLILFTVMGYTYGWGHGFYLHWIKK